MPRHLRICYLIVCLCFMVNGVVFAAALTFGPCGGTQTCAFACTLDDPAKGTYEASSSTEPVPQCVGGGLPNCDPTAARKPCNTTVYNNKQCDPGIGGVNIVGGNTKNIDYCK